MNSLTQGTHKYFSFLFIGSFWFLGSCVQWEHDIPNEFIDTFEERNQEFFINIVYFYAIDRVDTYHKGKGKNPSKVDIITETAPSIRNGKETHQKPIHYTQTV
jgi:hypothetical protein